MPNKIPDAEALPFDQGRRAYKDRKSEDDNPYPESSWQHDEWWKGWNDAAECDPDESWDWTQNKFK